jgi:hypothetical protein
MADNSRLRALANAAFHAPPLDAGVRFSEGPVIVRNVPFQKQGLNNNQGRRQPPITMNEFNESLGRLQDEYNELKPKCVDESARLLIDPILVQSASKDDYIKYRDALNNLIIAETRCKNILQMIAGLNRIHGQPYNPVIKTEFDELKRDIARNKIVLDYVNNTISNSINTSNFPMEGGKKKRKAKRKTKRKT